ncbi:MAG TPA: glutamine amidotransferase, partial [Planctomycetia bacterium]|nr:glutamine amidotransferase [Planctomycetia bacterium]
MEPRFAPVWPWPLAIALAIGLVSLALWTYPAGTPRRRLLLALRMLAIFLGLFAFWRPAVEYKKTVEQSSSLVLLYDRSRSMNLRDMWRNLSRFEAVRDLRKEADADIARLSEKVKIAEFSFDRKLAEVGPDTWEKAPEGNQTALGEALAETAERYGDERIAMVLVLSDGVNNYGADPAEIRRQLAARNIPVHAFGFGSETASEQVRDILPTRIDVSSVAFKKNRLTVKAEFQTNGFANQKIPVKLKFDGEEKARGEIRVSAEGQRALAELTAIPERAGDMKVTIEAEPQPGELLATNNAISTYVSVRSDGLGVLHIEGKYRYWEPKFLRRAIDLSPDIDLTQVFLLDTAGKPTELPDDLFQPGKYDAVILGDVAAARIPPEAQDKLAAMLRAGAGLMMIGGYDSFGAGGWDRSKIAEYIPVQMRPGDIQVETELKVVPTDSGLRHFILRLLPDGPANLKAWESLRPLDGGSQWSGLKQNALVLATAPDKQPLLVASEIGKTRTLAFAGDTTWRWATKNREGKLLHARFWRQLTLWLAHREDASGNQVRIRLDRRRVAVGDRLPIEVAVTGADGQPARDAKLECTIRLGDEPPAPVTLVRQGDVFKGTIAATEKPGDYVVAVQATRGTEPLGAATAKYLVYDEDLELRQLAADFEGLKKLAADTRGEFHNAEEFPKFFKNLEEKNLN